MIAVIFEVGMPDARQDDYLAIAAELHPLLEQIDGFISVERFGSLTRPGKLLSLSFFRDEAAVAEWRRLSHHRAAQSAGRDGIFTDYRLRVCTVLRDYGMNDRNEAPPDSAMLHGPG